MRSPPDPSRGLQPYHHPVSAYFTYPYLNADVELTDEREAHIHRRHPDVIPGNLELIAQTLSIPQAVRRSPQRSDTLLISRWYDDFLGGKYLNVVVKTDRADVQRNWVVTAYPSRTPVRGEHLWSRS